MLRLLPSWQGIRTCMLVLPLGSILLMGADRRTLLPRLENPPTAIGEHATNQRTVRPDRSRSDVVKTRKSRRTVTVRKGPDRRFMMGSSAGKTVRVPIKGRPSKQEAEKPRPIRDPSPEEIDNELQRIDALPLRGWTMLHDGRFDPVNSDDWLLSRLLR